MNSVDVSSSASVGSIVNTTTHAKSNQNCMKQKKATLGLYFSLFFGYFCILGK